MKRFKNWFLLGGVGIIILLLGPAKAALAQQSTTGPFPLPGIDRGISMATLAPVVIPEVPSYLWHHGCGPTALGMVIGYWDGQGVPLWLPDPRQLRLLLSMP